MDFKTTHNASELKRLHQKELGMDVPEGYFSSSKKDILSKTIYQSKRTRVIKWMGASMSVAAAIVIFVFLKTGTNKVSDENQILNEFDNDVLISSLFVSNKKVDTLTDVYMLEGLIDENDF
ncbi:hypothetical protein [Wenyingzhuangia sp. 2_MG-2023]|uniref:hypothetical protein n=1 Tax=Wenyingzhuangia sp. 2_MG-2023 TaxID=3062639 RepID=UPI0026E3D0B2|nr:hypothetical protein [Wenyingzhuangia sp. 2_MG-2023]MDO6738639.1 hypothetical protein [Wenyingzhuangia sp. 2_MG-2023]MDO6803518.1 hypothetical protein [Wenyingzhuangia sp. 1_MG-2023]